VRTHAGEAYNGRTLDRLSLDICGPPSRNDAPDHLLGGTKTRTVPAEQPVLRSSHLAGCPIVQIKIKQMAFCARIRLWNKEVSPDRRRTAIRDSIPNQEDHGFYLWGNWSSGTGCSPFVGVSWEPRALPAGLHQRGERIKNNVYLER
jgi:hypothetical protein